MTHGREEVLVVPRPVLLEDGLFVGMRPPDPKYLERIRRGGVYRPRDQVEDDPSFKQVIPYVVVRRGDEVFLFQRLRRGGEARLYGLYSVGVGGHVSRSDGAAGDPVEAGLARELREEVEFSAPWEVRWVGVLNDERNPVSAVHFGLVYEATTAGEVRVREQGVLRGAFVPVQEAVAYYDRMETWSQLVVDGFGWRRNEWGWTLRS